MNRKEREAVEAMYAHYHGVCFVSGKKATQRAHIIGDTKMNRSKYGSGVIDNPLDWLPAHSLKENALIDIGKSEFLCDKIAFMISIGDRAGIEQLVRCNIDRKINKLNMC